MTYKYSNTKRILNELLNQKPRLVCICRNPNPGEFNLVFLRAKCNTCGHSIDLYRLEEQKL